MCGQASTDEVNEVEHLKESSEEANITQPLLPSYEVKPGPMDEVNEVDHLKERS